VTLETGQDSSLVLMFAGLSVFLLRKNLDFWRGLRFRSARSNCTSSFWFRLWFW
jgi:hypothetical protein